MAAEGVPEWYSGRSVFVTGGTGFLGKVLAEKLLRSCPGIKNIYLLVRPKKGQDGAARLQNLLKSQLFDKLREERPKDLEKVVPISGDITLPELGISKEDQELLAQTVSVVFHSAATVNFDEPLKFSVVINVLGTRRMLTLCKNMPNLKSLIHVSTAYCNCDRFEVDEEIYPVPWDPVQIIQTMEWMDEDIVEALTPKIIGKRPNTYTFTKVLAEHLILKEGKDLPIAIVRPSIVIGSSKEPFPGWIDNYNGPTAIAAASATGLCRTLQFAGDAVMDLIPVDYVVNFMICAAWYTAVHSPKNVMVYNCCTSEKNPVTINELVDKIFEVARKMPLIDCMWYPEGLRTDKAWVYKIAKVFLHYLPAYFVDSVNWALGRKQIMIKMYTRLDKVFRATSFFANNEWRFTGKNVATLQSAMSLRDRMCFSVDVRDIDWHEMLTEYNLGIRKYLFNDSLETVPAARWRLLKYYFLHRGLQLFLVLIFLLIIWQLCTAFF